MSGPAQRWSAMPALTNHHCKGVSGMADWHSTPKGLAQRRKYRKRTNNAATKRYEKTKPGFLMRAYRNILSRVTGIQKGCQHIYKGLPALPKQEFYDWALADPDFHRLWDDWVASGYARTLTPSIDRINQREGYVPGNIRWIPMAENSARARATMLTVNGVTRSIPDWARDLGIAINSLHGRLRRGWPPEAAVSVSGRRSGLRR